MNMDQVQETSSVPQNNLHTTGANIVGDTQGYHTGGVSFAVLVQAGIMVVAAMKTQTTGGGLMIKK